MVTSQFGVPPEWLIDKEPAPAVLLAGVSPFLSTARLPILLVVVGLALVALRRMRPEDGLTLAATLGAGLLLGIVAVMRTTGPIFDYRLNWTWVVPMVAFVTVAWTSWLAITRKWPDAGARVLTASAIAGLAVISVVNVATASRAATRHEESGDLLAELTPQVLDALAGHDSVVAVSDVGPIAGRPLTRGLLLQLERHGIDTVIRADRASLGTPDQIRDDTATSETPLRLYVAIGDEIEEVRSLPDAEVVAVASNSTVRAAVVLLPPG